ncbi:hypothetical protein DLEV_088 [Diachasmimorpha longicaudata entomopoxvirus]|uniref:Uncharacterized protein n=1 Tax=Diachasmimorpha longicaudata entomopoxvirus TaxID=109981 RepID=A0A7R5WM31_9POXV|nr:hypothetical protein QKK69_gp088 [Diachasmimorpha longicaudata entomopoxvirus]AKS26379.1 hypothetical protein DLEV_088 [Diachasmimorpha longicaudata entomopoxvirus]
MSIAAKIYKKKGKPYAFHICYAEDTVWYKYLTDLQISDTRCPEYCETFGWEKMWNSQCAKFCWNKSDDSRYKKVFQHLENLLTECNHDMYPQKNVYFYIIPPVNNTTDKLASYVTNLSSGTLVDKDVIFLPKDKPDNECYIINLFSTDPEIIKDESELEKIYRELKEYQSPDNKHHFRLAQEDNISFILKIINKHTELETMLITYKSLENEPDIHFFNYFT